jgi:protein MpaA
VTPPHRRAWVTAAIAALVLAAAASVSKLDHDSVGAATQVPTNGDRNRTPATKSLDTVHLTRMLGRSVRHRPIRVSEIGRQGQPSILVVGCIHGNEPAGIAVTRDLLADRAPHRILLWLIPDLNPDGVAAGTRQNAHAVDLNRNFPWRWRRIGRPGDVHYSGPRPLSEPESRMARRLILNRRPRISIWFHQHDDVVDESGGDLRVERRYARLTHMRLVRLPRYPGSATGWQNHALRGSTAFVVELPPGSLGPSGVERFSDAILRLLG